MHIKLSGIADEMNKIYFKDFEITKENIDYEMHRMILFLKNKMKEENIEMVSGSGKRKSNEQKLLDFVNNNGASRKI